MLGRECPEKSFPRFNHGDTEAAVAMIQGDQAASKVTAKFGVIHICCFCRCTNIRVGT